MRFVGGASPPSSTMTLDDIMIKGLNKTNDRQFRFSFSKDDSYFIVTDSYTVIIFGSRKKRSSLFFCSIAYFHRSISSMMGSSTTSDNVTTTVPSDGDGTAGGGGANKMIQQAASEATAAPPTTTPKECHTHEKEEKPVTSFCVTSKMGEGRIGGGSDDDEKQRSQKEDTTMQYPLDEESSSQNDNDDVASFASDSENDGSIDHNEDDDNVPVLEEEEEVVVSERKKEELPSSLEDDSSFPMNEVVTTVMEGHGPEDENDDNDNKTGKLKPIPPAKANHPKAASSSVVANSKVVLPSPCQQQQEISDDNTSSAASSTAANKTDAECSSPRRKPPRRNSSSNHRRTRSKTALGGSSEHSSKSVDRSSPHNKNKHSSQRTASKMMQVTRSEHTARTKSSSLSRSGGSGVHSTQGADHRINTLRKPPRSPSKMMMQTRSEHTVRTKSSSMSLSGGSEHSTQGVDHRINTLRKPPRSPSKMMMQTRSEHTVRTKSSSRSLSGGSEHSTRSADGYTHKPQRTATNKMMQTRSEHTVRSKSLPNNNGSEHGTRRVYLSKVPAGGGSARSTSLIGASSEHTTVSAAGSSLPPSSSGMGSAIPEGVIIAQGSPAHKTKPNSSSPRRCTASAIPKGSAHSNSDRSVAMIGGLGGDSVHSSSTRSVQRSTSKRVEENSRDEIHPSKSLNTRDNNDDCQDLAIVKTSLTNNAQEGDIENGTPDAGSNITEKDKVSGEKSKKGFLQMIVQILVQLNCLRVDEENDQISTNWARCLQWLALSCDMVAAIVALVTFSDVTYCCGTEMLDIAGDIPWRNVTRAATYIYLVLIFAEIYPVVHRGFPFNLVNPLIGFVITFAMFFDDSKNEALAMWGVETAAIAIEYVLFRVKVANLDAKDDDRIELKALLKDGKTKEPDDEQEGLKKKYEALKVEITKDRMMLFYLQAGCYLNIFLCLIILALIIFVWQSGGLCMSNFKIDLLDLNQLGRCPLCTNHSGVCEICTEEVTQCYYPYS